MRWSSCCTRLTFSLLLVLLYHIPNRPLPTPSLRHWVFLHPLLFEPSLSTRIMVRFQKLLPLSPRSNYFLKFQISDGYFLLKLLSSFYTDSSHKFCLISPSFYKDVQFSYILHPLPHCIWKSLFKNWYMFPSSLKFPVHVHVGLMIRFHATRYFVEKMYSWQ